MELRLVLACLNTVCYCRRAQTGFGMLQSVIVGELRLVLACFRLLCRGAQTGFGMLQSVIVGELRLVFSAPEPKAQR